MLWRDRTGIAASIADLSRWRWGEMLFWTLALMAILLFPNRYLILTEIAWLALFVLSLDLILGYAGILSLGHAAFFGVGAYVAGLLALHHYIDEPVLALLVAGLAAMALGFVTSFLVMRGADLTRLMVTLGIALLLRELANRFSNITGGFDGLQGIVMAPVLGLFEFDLFGKTSFIYCLVVLFVMFLLARRIVHSPFGLSLRAIRNNPLRAAAIGIPVNRRLIAIYTIAAFYAGIAGGALDAIDCARLARRVLVRAFRRSAAGAGDRRHGLSLRRADRSGGLQAAAGRAGDLDAAILAVLDRADPRHPGAGWPRTAAALDHVGPGSHQARVRQERDGGRGRGEILVTLALETQGLIKTFGGLTATRDLSLKVERGARHALIGPNGAGKTTVINLLTGVLRPNSGRVLLEGTDITALPAHKRALMGLSRTFQINQLFADLSPLESIALAVSEQRGEGMRWWSSLVRDASAAAEVEALLQRFHLADVMNVRTATLPYGKQRLLEIALAIAAKPRVLLLDEPAAGVPEAERHDILAAVASLPREVSVLLIEHDMDLVFSFADRISVLVNGALFVEGPPNEVARDPRVKAVYLGEAADA